jgi:hypothetical protein
MACISSKSPEEGGFAIPAAGGEESVSKPPKFLHALYSGMSLPSWQPEQSKGKRVG